jgi:hypothetical protein
VKRIYLEQKNLAPSTINVRLAAVRRLAFEVADAGLLSPELAAASDVLRVSSALGRALAIGLRSIRAESCSRNRPCRETLALA